jgi:hypothetical protein
VVKQYYKQDFHFENSWLLEEDIGEVVHDGWNDGNGLEITHRLTHCDDKLQRWGRRKKRRFKDELWSMKPRWRVLETNVIQLV